MAIADELGIRLTLHVVSAGVSLLTALVLWTLPHRAAKVLAVTSGSVAIFYLFVATVRTGPLTLDNFGWSDAQWVSAWITQLGSLAAVWLYPAPPRSWVERVALAVAALWILASAWFLLARGSASSTGSSCSCIGTPRAQKA